MHVHIWQSWIKENVTNMSAKKVNVEVYIDCKRISALLSRMNTLSHFFFFFQSQNGLVASDVLYMGRWRWVVANYTEHLVQQWASKRSRGHTFSF